MNKIDLTSMTIAKAHEAMKVGEFSPIDLVKAYLENISNTDKDIHAYLEIYEDAIGMAEIALKKFKDGTATLLTGIPISVKDNILVKGHVASAASKILEKYIAPYDATAIARLRKEGAVFIGRTNMDEFAMGGSTENYERRSGITRI
jgi:aspartyl-tRNA(Asn)/glutamyl-tRNA(Gln) amidotransferase subunit A